MLINSVILVLQETLEAALLISVLLSISYQRKLGVNWLPIGVIGGVIFSIVYATNLAVVSAWFDYVGQEIVNALLQACITLLIAVYGWVVFTPSASAGGEINSPVIAKSWLPLVISASAAIIVVMAITREGSEVYLYINGFFQGSPHLPSVLSGSALGFGIGLSISTLLFYALSGDHNRWGRDLATLLLALFAGSMLSQSVLQLTQADWITASTAYWDTSAWISEHSITGKLLYASMGYEATPSAQQIIAYLSGLLMVLAVVTTRLTLAAKSSEKS